jgi:hypothetical protein
VERTAGLTGEFVFWDLGVNGPARVRTGELHCTSIELPIVLSLAANGGGKLVLTNNTNDNKIWLEAYNKDGDGSANELLLTGAGGTEVPVTINGHLTKASGNFKIDHPVDPEHKYLQHSFVESPDMKNIYDGVVTLGDNGEAWIELPAYFEALNCDFRYQLTCIGKVAPVYVSDEIACNRFRIAGGEADMKVSWQVTGTRIDRWAEAHRFPVEALKSPEERGLYLHPEVYGLPMERSITYHGRVRIKTNILD